jgi:hypothetical protein
MDQPPLNRHERDIYGKRFQYFAPQCVTGEHPIGQDRKHIYLNCTQLLDQMESDPDKRDKARNSFTKS